MRQHSFRMMTCQINPKSHQHNISDRPLQISSHIFVNFGHPGNVGKSNPRHIAAPAGGPAIIRTSAHILHCSQYKSKELKTADKQDFQLTRCPLYGKKKIKFYFFFLDICCNLSDIFLFLNRLLLAHTILPCQNDNQEWMNPKQSYFLHALTSTKPDFWSLGVKNKNEKRDFVIFDKLSKLTSETVYSF